MLTILAVSLLSLTGCSQVENESLNKQFVTDEVLVVTEGQKTSTNSYAMPSKLTFSGENIVRTATAGYTASVTLTATVLPIEATNKEVDWSIAWLDAPTNGESSVTDFVTVTPTADGSTTATITCKKAFGDDKIVVTVTTRIGGFKAECVVSYFGEPTSLTVEPKGATLVDDNIWNVSIANVYCGTTYNFDLNLDNEFGMVGSSFTSNYTISIEAIGSFEAQQINYTSHGTTYGATQTMTLKSFVNMASSGNEYFSCSITNGKLQVIPKNVLSNVYTIIGASSQGSSGLYYKSSTSQMPYIKVTITETNSGLSTSINLRVQSEVSSIGLSSETLQF